MISREKDGITTTYLHDGAGRLVEVQQDGQPIAQYAYDGHGRLVKTTEFLPTGNRITLRLPMGNETAYEKITDGVNTTTRKYIVGNGRYLAKVEREGNGPEEVSYYHNDHLGSIRTVSSADVATMTYDAYGKLIESTGAIDEHNHWYTGKPVDSTGLYYYGARFYDPELGRFITVDPARDGLNWYAYAAGNPLKYVDPDGRVITPANWVGLGTGAISGLVGYTVSVLVTGTEWKWKDASIAMGAGAAFGFIAPWTGHSMLATMGLAASTSLVQYIATEGVNGRSPTLEGLSWGVVTSAFSTIAGPDQSLYAMNKLTREQFVGQIVASPARFIQVYRQNWNNELAKTALRNVLGVNGLRSLLASLGTNLPSDILMQLKGWYKDLTGQAYQEKSR